jgi:magnesium chelatase subunit D
VSPDGSAQAPSFPFSAVVGQDDVKLALLLNALDPRIGGVLLRGQKGSAKSTLARGLAALLDEAPFVELPVGSTEDRLVGTLDLTAALTGGHRRFEPGLLAAAHGGVLYVDEVNLLPDHLVDVLLDVAASGVNRVEREGVSHTHPSRFVLIGSMNPEEGDLRPQLLDRFGLAVEVRAPDDPALRAVAVTRRLAFDADPDHSARRWSEGDLALAASLRTARPAPIPEEVVGAVTALCAEVGAEGLRADLTICRASAALAGWEGRDEVSFDDVRRVAPMALAHRGRRGPLEASGMDPERIGAALDEALRRSPAESSGDPPAAAGAPGDRADAQASGTGADGWEDPEGSKPDGSKEGGSKEGGSKEVPPRSGQVPPGSAPARRTLEDRQVPPVVRPVRVEAATPPAVQRERAPGRRTPGPASRGRVVGDRELSDDGGAVAFAPTVRAAVARRGGAAPGEGETLILPADLREAVRVARRASLVVIAVDASGSMGADRRMAAAKQAVLGLLVDAYQRRDLVGMVAFRDDGAQVLLRPTGSVEVARARLAELPSGGRTPLAEGVLAALALATSPARSQSHDPLLVVVTDGRATAAPAGQDPMAAAMAAAAEVRRRGVPAVVVDAEDGPIRLGLAGSLAAAMGARLVSMTELKAPGMLVGRPDRGEPPDQPPGC